MSIHGRARTNTDRNGQDWQELSVAARAGVFAGILNIPLHSEVPKALAPTVAQPDRRPAFRGAEGALGNAMGL